MEVTNESRAYITRLIHVDQSQGLKSVKEREGEISEMKKAPPTQPRPLWWGWVGGWVPTHYHATPLNFNLHVAPNSY